MLLHEAVEAMRPAADAEAVTMRAELSAALAAARGNPEQAAARALQPDPERDPPHAAPTAA